jgi:hypothetical protein
MRQVPGLASTPLYSGKACRMVELSSVPLPSTTPQIDTASPGHERPPRHPFASRPRQPAAFLAAVQTSCAGDKKTKRTNSSLREGRLSKRVLTRTTEWGIMRLFKRLRDLGVQMKLNPARSRGSKNLRGLYGRSRNQTGTESSQKGTVPCQTVRFRR